MQNNFVTLVSQSPFTLDGTLGQPHVPYNVASSSLTHRGDISEKDLILIRLFGCIIIIFNIFLQNAHYFLISYSELN